MRAPILEVGGAWQIYPRKQGPRPDSLQRRLLVVRRVAVAMVAMTVIAVSLQLYSTVQEIGCWL